MNEAIWSALIGGVIGTFFGGLTSFLWEILLPNWMTWRRTRQIEREHQLATVRAPAYLAFFELRARLRAIAWTQAGNYKYVQTQGEGDYYVHSTAYLVAQALAWQVILRDRMASYDYPALYRCLHAVTEALSAGNPGFQVYRLSQREIGERMIITLASDDWRCTSFSDFLDQVETTQTRWITSLVKSVRHLLDHPRDELDRVESIDRALSATLALIDSKARWIPPDVDSRPIDANRIREHLQHYT